LERESIHKRLDKSFEELNYLFESSSFTFFGHRFVSEKKYFDALEGLREAIKLSLEDARVIELNAERLLEEAKEEAEAIVSEAKQEVEEMDKVQMAKIRARDIITASRDKAVELLNEGEEMRENSISQAEHIRERIINGTHEVINGELSKILSTIEDSYALIDESLEKTDHLLSQGEGIDKKDVS